MEEKQEIKNAKDVVREADTSEKKDMVVKVSDASGERTITIQQDGRRFPRVSSVRRWNSDG